MKPSITRLRVLIVDSDGAARRLYVEALRPLRCEAVEASDGREALVEALVRRPSAVVMDSWLPIVDGAALCEILRRDPLTRTVPIVAIAAAGDEGNAESLRRAGASSVLVKPVEAGALAAELRRLFASGGAAGPPPAIVPRVPLTAGGIPGKRIANCRLHVRCTTTAPPVSPPELRCPICDGELLYERSYLGGVSQREAEQWDDYVCPACGTFEYRHRTRRLRELSVAR